MAELIANGLILVLVRRFITITRLYQPKFLKGVHKQVESLKEELEIIEPFLRDTEALSTRGEVNDATEVWLRQLRDKANLMKAVIDKYTDHLQHQPNPSRFFGSLLKGAPWLKSSRCFHKIVYEINDVEESLTKIKARGMLYVLSSSEQGRSSIRAVVNPWIGSPSIAVASISMESTASFSSSKFTDDVEE